jgi:hypothetical protein
MRSAALARGQLDESTLIHVSPVQSRLGWLRIDWRLLALIIIQPLPWRVKTTSYLPNRNTDLRLVRPATRPVERPSTGSGCLLRAKIGAAAFNSCTFGGYWPLWYNDDRLMVLVSTCSYDRTYSIFRHAPVRIAN